jgi:nitrogen fixation/metabolism regulation signal transduction histidine kinase
VENPITWWISQIILFVVAIFFIIFGIDLLYTAYQLNEPFSFIMTFFASNLIILISATLLFIFVWNVVRYIKRTREKEG